jgi:hypothetical protein
MLGLFERMGSDPGIRRFKSYNPGAHGLGIRATVRRTPWVAEITGRDERYGLERDFLDYRKDYAEASRRGDFVKRWFVLPPGIYEIHEVLSVRRHRRYFVRSVHGVLTEITREEVERWLDENEQNAK